MSPRADITIVCFAQLIASDLNRSPVLNKELGRTPCCAALTCRRDPLARLRSPSAFLRVFSIPEGIANRSAECHGCSHGQPRFQELSSLNLHFPSSLLNIG